MLYAAATFWLLIIVLLAWGVHHLWSALVQPKVVNSVLLPGTLVAQLGHALGVLVTGGTVNKLALMADDDSGQPPSPDDARPRVPIVGPVVVALLPMVALGTAIYQSVKWVGGPIMRYMPAEQYVPAAVPQSMAATWAQLRNLISLAQYTLDAVRQVDLMDWRNALFVYLLICMSVRMAPLPGNLRGHLGAVVVTGLLAALLGNIAPGVSEWLIASWPVLTLTIATLVLLLMASLVIRGVIGLVKILARG